MMRSMETKELMLANRDGKRMPSTLRMPRGAPKGTVVLVHGLGGLRDQTLLRRMAESLANDGYAAFSFDDSHAIRSIDARFFDATATKSVRDLEDAIGYAKAAEWFSPPLVLLGHSMGGFAAVRYARLHPEDAKQLVLLAPATYWRTLKGTILFGLLWLVTGRQKIFAIDEEHAVLGRAWMLDFLKYDARRDAKRIAVPTLIVSAGLDEVVDTPAQHARFAARFPHATHVTIAGANHDFDGREDEVVATIRQWLTSS